MFYKFCFVLICSVIFFSVTTVSAQDKEIELVLDNTKILISGSIRMDLIFPNAEDIPAPELTEAKGLKISYLRSTDIISRSDGIFQHSIKHTYIIMPEQIGIFEIGPFNFKYNGVDYVSGKVGIQVSSGFSDIRPKSDNIIKEEESRSKDNIFLLMATDKKRVYVNQVFQIVVGLYYKDINLTDIQYPLLMHEGFSMDEFHAPQTSRKTIKGYNYRIITFRNSIFPLKSGNLKLGPAAIACNSQVLDVIASSGLADKVFRKSSLQLESASKDISVLPIPEDGKPKSFDGAVGDFDFNLNIEPKGPVEVGDTIIITMEITGKGNLALLSAPSIDESEDYILYKPYLKKEGKAYRIFEQVLIPKVSTLEKIPQVRFSFFDPEEERFKTITKGHIEVKISERDKNEKPKIMEGPGNIRSEPGQELLGRGIVYIKDLPGRFKQKGAYLYRDKRFLLFQSMPLLLYISMLVFCKRRERFQNDIRYARAKIADRQARKALKKARSLLNENSVEGFYISIFECLQEYFGNKFNLPSGGITSDIVDNVLKPKKFDESIITQVNRFFNDCDIAKFTPYRYDKKDMSRSFNQAKEIIGYFRKV